MDLSWEMVMAKLQDITAQEDKSRPLSDDAIAKEHVEVGLIVARRTVTNDRQAMNITIWRGRRKRSGTTTT